MSSLWNSISLLNINLKGIWILEDWLPCTLSFVLGLQLLFPSLLHALKSHLSFWPHVAASSFDFQITGMTSDQNAFHYVQLISLGLVSAKDLRGFYCIKFVRLTTEGPTHPPPPSPNKAKQNTTLSSKNMENKKNDVTNNTCNNIHEKISPFWLVKSSAVFF